MLSLARSRASRGLVRLCATFLVCLLATATLHAAPAPAAQSCSAADLDLTLRFSNEPATTWTMAVLARNAAPHACTLSGHDVPAFVTTDPHPAVPIELCTQCDRKSSSGPASTSETLTLEPDETAHETFRWSTQQAPGAPACQSARWLSTQSSVTHEHTLFFVAPGLLPPICSQVDVEGFARGTVFDEEDLPPQQALPALPSLHLSTPANHLYAGEFLTLQAESHATLNPANPITHGCPLLLLRQRAPDGYTRYDEMREPRIRCATMRSLPLQQIHINTSFDSLAHLAALDPGDNIVQFLQLAGPLQSPRVALAESNRVTLRVIDPTSAPRRWGTPQRGLRVDLTLDKNIFGLGEDIPLHIAAEVLSAPDPLFGEPYVRRPDSYDASAGSFHLAITSTSGPQPGADLASNLYRRVGPAEGPVGCPVHLPLNSVLPLERSLKLYGLLPTVPGTYQLVVEWTPYVSHASACDQATPRESVPYATAVSNPVIIRIAGGPSPVEEVDSLPEYAAWKSNFVLTDTSLGKHTSLLDRTTHLEWLTLAVTANKSQETLGRMMAPKHPLDGWRFATQDEVIAMFADFTGASDGRSQDPAVERKLQELLGGPLATPKSTGAGRKQRITNGQIAGFDTPPGYFNQPAAAPRFQYHYAAVSETEENGNVTAVVDPHLTGWTDGDRTTPANGTFLVRPH